MMVSFGQEKWWSPRSTLRLGVCLLVAHAAGGVGLLVSSAPGEWYRSLTPPPGTPPGFVFGIVWPILYTLIGIALFLFLRRTSGDLLRTGLMVFALQWFLNALWTPLFFGLQQPVWALVDLLVLLVALGWTIQLFRQASTRAGYLLLPYFFWSLYAAYLNTGFVFLNVF
jgi:benzodiazapine receptor